MSLRNRAFNGLRSLQSWVSFLNPAYAATSILNIGKSAALSSVADLHHQRGGIAAACERLREARTLLDRALTLAPNHPEIAAELARVADLLRALCPDPATGDNDRS